MNFTVKISYFSKKHILYIQMNSKRSNLIKELNFGMVHTCYNSWTTTRLHSETEQHFNHFFVLKLERAQLLTKDVNLERAFTSLC